MSARTSFIFLLLLFLSLAGLLAAGNRYEIAATIDAAMSGISGTAVLTYTNETPTALDSIPVVC